MYNELLNNNDDYYLQESVVDINSTYLAPDGAPNEYLIPLNVDVERIRYVDGYQNGYWVPLEKFPLSMKDMQPGQIYYRLKNDNLWLIGSNFLQISKIKIGYYPVRDTITVPDDPIEYGTALAPSVLATITGAFWVEEKQTMLYIQGTTTLVAESKATGTTTTLYTGTGLKTPWYYRGYVYIQEGTQIKRVASDLTSTIVPVVIVATANNYTIGHYNGDFLYYDTGANTTKANLDGTSPTVAFASSTLQYTTTIDGALYLTAGGVLSLNGVPFGPTLSTFAVYGEYIYGLVATTNTLWIWKLVNGSLVQVDTVPQVYMIGKTTETGRLPVLYADSFQAISPVIDYSFEYPNNAVFEILAYQSAADFVAKGKGDPTMILMRLKSLWDTFKTSIRRDDYKPQRINNRYKNVGG